MYTVWQYWEGRKPDWISLCLDTSEKHIATRKLLNLKSFRELHNGDSSFLTRLSHNHVSDYVRAYLLAKHGGLYVDADCVVMRDVDPILEDLDRYHFVVYGLNFKLRAAACAIVGTAQDQGEIASIWLRICRERIKKGNLGWGALGPHGLTTAMKEADSVIFEKDNKHNTVKNLPWDQVHPIHWWGKTWQFLVERTDEEHEGHFKEEAYCYMATHKLGRRLIGKKITGRRKLMESRMFLSYLFRRSLLCS